MEKKNAGRQMDMVRGPLAGNLLLFALPLMLSSILQLLFNAADVVVVGRYAGDDALAAVGSTSSLINLLVNFFNGLSVGTNVVVARDLGAERIEETRRSVHTSVAIALLSGGVLLLIGVLFSHQFLVWMSSPTEVIGLSTLYLRIYFLGMPALMLYNFGSAVLRAKGDTRRPLYFLFTAGVVNVILNLFFVIGFHLSVAGVAIATVISQYISASLVLWALTRESGPLRLDLRALRIDKQTVLRIGQVGLPAGFQGTLFSVSNVAIQSSINSFDSVAITAGSAASSSIEGFVYVSMNAFYQACLTFTSQNCGAGEGKRIDRILLFCALYASAFGLVLGSLVSVFGEPLTAIYAPGKAATIAQAVIRLRIVAGTYFLCGLMDVPVGTLRGIGYSVLPMVVSLLGACGLRLLWIAFVFPFWHTPESLYVSYPVSWAVTAAVHYCVFFAVRKKAYERARYHSALPVKKEAS